MRPLYFPTMHLHPAQASKPLLSINRRQLFQFEHLRKRETAEQRRLITTTSKIEGAAEEVENRHHGKEIVDYGEDGLAVYADGTREERKRRITVPYRKKKRRVRGRNHSFASRLKAI
jgi:hypothetical protein